jgi:hypothetical protein
VVPCDRLVLIWEKARHATQSGRGSLVSAEAQIAAWAAVLPASECQELVAYVDETG